MIVQTYNRPDYLRNALASVLAQTYRDFEVIVWNDGGSDEAGAVVDSFADERITYRRSPANQGLMMAAISAWKVANGEMVAHLDDDDTWEPSYLATLVPILESNPELSLAFCNHWIMNDSGVIDRDATNRNSAKWGRSTLEHGIHQPAFAIAVSGSICIATAALVRKRFIDLDLAPREIRECPDRWMAYMATRGGSGIFYVPQRLARVRRHSGGQLTRRVASTSLLSDTSHLYGIFLSDPVLADFRPALSKAYAVATANLAIALCRDGATIEARACALKAVTTRLTLRGLSALAIAALPARLSLSTALALDQLLSSWRGVASPRWRRRTS